MSAASAASRAAPPQLAALTGIRGIAAWMVVFYHIRLSLLGLVPLEVIAIFAKGYLAVDLFFMLSGFVLWYNYADRLRGGGVAAAGDFMWRRIARIWPLHVVILALCGAMIAGLALTGRSLPGYPLAELPLHLLLMQNWGFTGALTWNHPAWSISTELAAYLLFPLTLGLVRWEKVRSVWLLATGAGLMIALYLIYASQGYATLGKGIAQLGLIRCLIEFAAGNLLCILWQRWRDLPKAGFHAALACTGIVAAGFWLKLPETAFAPIAFATGLMALALDRGSVARALGGRVLLYFGEISYSTYLVHRVLFILCKFVLVDATLQIGGGGLALYFAALGLASVALYHLVEKPAQRWMNRHRPRLPKPASAVPAE